MTSRLPGYLLAALFFAAQTAAAPKPNPDAGRVAHLTAKLFEQAHYNHHKLDAPLAAKFLQKYIEALDYTRMFFWQGDLKDFEQYRPTLVSKTLADDATPAFEIFDRYQQRVGQAVACAKEFLKQPPEFKGDEKIQIDRTKAQWPADEAAAKELWRLRVKHELLQEHLNKTKPEEAVRLVTRRYDRLLRAVNEMDADDIIEAYVNALCHAYDPHSDYLGKSELKNFEITMKLSLFGIGAVLKSEDGYTKIVSLVPGGPADMSRQFKVNDRIVAVAQGEDEPVDVVDMKLNKVVELIRGAKDTKVRLTVIPATAADSSVRKIVTLVREEIKLTEQEAKAKVIEAAANGSGVPRKLGVIEVPSFYADTDRDRNGDDNVVSTTRHVATLIEKLQAQHVDGIVLDLRRNGGGLLDEAVALAGLFIKQGPIVQVKDYRGRIQILEDEDPKVAYNGPLLVLTSHISASASEIFAAAMQDYGRALVVGDSKTFGKGTVQTMLPMANWAFGDSKAGALKLTTQKFYRIAGGSTQHRGVIPDIVMPSIYDSREIGESALDNAMPYDEVSSAVYSREAAGQQGVAELRKRSADRLNKDRDFGYLKEDIARLTQQIKDGYVSLNLDKRQQEKKTDEARTDARKKERKARNSPEPKLTEIVLHPKPQTASAAAASTQPTAAAKTPHDAASDEDAEDDEDAKKPAVDATLNEALAILNDMVGLAGNANGAKIANTASPAAPEAR
ncbi:MAG: carboxy terminal-processing peptidase [Verrucomicrobia bacterium]|nr:carboxy terminal-processing peptidase [Verrucomicrobiota bacterium]